MQILVISNFFHDNNLDDKITMEFNPAVRTNLYIGSGVIHIEY